MLLINGSHREKNCFNILNDIKNENDVLLSLSNKNIKFCVGCNQCKNKLEKLCIINDFITNEIYSKIIENNKIVLASPLYISNISGMLKTLIDRLNPFYNHNLLEGKHIYLILTGQGSYDDNFEEIMMIIKYFEGISEWLGFKFHFLKYFSSGDLNEIDDIKIENINYSEMINDIINNLNRIEERD